MPKLKLPAPPVPPKLRPAPKRPGTQKHGPLDGIGGILYPSRPTARRLDSLPQD